ETEYPTINDISILNREKSSTDVDNSFLDVKVDVEKTNSDIVVSQEKESFYIVKSGDTLIKIAREVYGDASKYTLIIKANNIKNASHIVTGKKLIIPKIVE
ncbi:MAG: LysM peptidoglycan-binding domain-containing protein, partial [Acidaminobacteraceae bacterium]